MQIEIIKAGIYTTVQDMGRFFYRSLGVPVSGAMDNYSARIANMVVGNSEDSAVIEFTLAGASFKTLTDVVIAYAGGGAVYKTGDRIIDPNKPVFIPANSIINLIASSSGCRSYLAISGGWNVEKVLESRSTYVPAAIGGYKGRILQAGDILSNDEQSCSVLSHKIIDALRGDKIKQANWHLRNELNFGERHHLIRVIKGREFDWFGNTDNFFSQPFTVSLHSNRMGYRLEGVKIHAEKKTELLSSAVLPGCIQVPHSGEIIMLMADCQATGGYPRIAQVALVDLPLCGQIKPGDAITFALISADEAEQLYVQQINGLNEAAESIKRKYNR